MMSDELSIPSPYWRMVRLGNKEVELSKMAVINVD